MSTYRILNAILLLVVILQALALKELHHWTQHHHENVHHCPTGTDTAHFHNEEHAHFTCTLCLFHFALLSPTETDYCLYPHDPFAKTLTIFTDVVNSFSSFRHYPQRGPPPYNA